jgi:pimeloyl-ACP methyl ester carboxylesterase
MGGAGPLRSTVARCIAISAAARGPSGRSGPEVAAGTTVELHGAGVRLAADAYGAPDAPPALLLHGGGQTRHAWGTTASVLADHGWRAYTVDLRGHGDSEWPADGDYSLDAFAADIRAMVAALPRTPVLVGASLGGISSLVAIAESPVPIASALVLVDVAPRMEPEGIQRITDFMTGHPDGFVDLDEVADAVAAYNPHRPRPRNLDGLRKNVRQRPDGRWTWHWDPRFIGNGPGSGRGSPDETRSMTDQARLEEAARAVTVPTLLVRGRVSDLLSEDGARQLLELIPHARLTDVAGAGHMVAGDRNDLFNEAVVAFLDEVRGSQPS